FSRDWSSDVCSSDLPGSSRSDDPVKRGAPRGVANRTSPGGEGQAEPRACNPGPLPVCEGHRVRAVAERSPGLPPEPPLEVVLDRGHLSRLARTGLTPLDLQPDPPALTFGDQQVRQG